MIIDAASWTPSADEHVDICVIGAGPAGIALADRLSGAGLRVLIVESGGPTPTVEAQRLNHGENVGLRYWPLHASRFRGVGGSGNRWGGWCRPFDPIDFEERDWVPGGGWPISYQTMAAHHAATNRFLGLSEDAFRADADGSPARPSPAAAQAGLEPGSYQFSPYQEAFGQGYTERLAAYDDVTVVLHATVVDLRLAAGSPRVQEAVIAGPGGALTSVRADTFVVAAGGIENARLLLAARHDRATGLGNERDLVGRYFMEHVHAHTGHLLSTDGSLADPYYLGIIGRPLGVPSGALVARPEVQRAERLLQVGLTLTAAPSPFGQGWRLRIPTALDAVLWRAEGALVPTQLPTEEAQSVSRAAVRSRASWLRQFSRDAVFWPQRRRFESAVARAGLPAGEMVAVYLRSEQVPNPSSRVTLGEGRDRFGVPVARLDWRLSEADLTSAGAWIDRLGEGLRASGTGLFVKDRGWADHVEGGPHHMGTTRMSSGPATGVVDSDCRVHTVENLYVAGSSVFPTGGYANPTYPLVALALRLGDLLRERSRRRVELTPPDPAPLFPPDP